MSTRSHHRVKCNPVDHGSGSGGDNPQIEELGQLWTESLLIPTNYSTKSIALLKDIGLSVVHVFLFLFVRQYNLWILQLQLIGMPKPLIIFPPC